MTSAPTSPLRRGAALLAAAVLVGALSAGPVRADSRTTKAKLDRAIRSLHSLEATIARENATIASMKADMQVIVDRMDKVQSQIATTTFKIIKKETEIEDAQGQLDATREQLNQRAWTVYENGPGSGLDFLLGAKSLSDLADRMMIVNSAATSDSDLIITIQEEQNRLRSKQAELESLQTQLKEKREELQDQQAELQAKLDAQQTVLRQLDRHKAAAGKLVRDLRRKYNAQRAAELEAARLARLRGGSHGGEKIGGVFFACPVAGGGVYSDDFGAPRYAGGYHLHAGNDMFAARGTPIVAPFAGTAQRSDNGLGGLAVKVFGARGYVYNAHVNSFIGAFPRHVNTGERIATVGNTGDAQGGATHDHFEYHPNQIPPPEQSNGLHVSPYGVSVVGGAIDPYPYLNSVC